LALTVVSRPGDTIAIESPSYFGFLQVLQALDLRALELPTEANSGVDLPALAKGARDDVGQSVSVVIELQQPTGLHHVRREEEGRPGIAREAADPADRGRHLWRYLFR